MDAFAFLAALRATRSDIDPELGVPYFSAEGKRLRRQKTKRKPGKRGEPVPGTGQYKYRFSKHFDCFGDCICQSNRTKRERTALRFEDKAN